MSESARLGEWGHFLVDPSFPSFFRLFLVVLARNGAAADRQLQALRHARKRKREKENEIERERGRARDSGFLEAFPAQYLLCTGVVCNHAFNSQSQSASRNLGARTRETSGSSYTKRKSNAAKHDELMD